MNRKIALWIVFGLFIISGFVFSADYLVEFKTRFYEGSREGEVEATEFVTSSYLQPTVTATIPARFLLSEEKAQISKVFNLKDVNLIAEADLQMSANKGSISHLLRLNGKAYRMKIAIQPKKKATHQFKIGVYEQAEEKETHLMDTDVILPQQKMAVLGFENKEGKPYFLSIQVTHVAGAPPPPPPPPKPPTATSYPTSAPLPPPPPPKEIKQNKKKIEEFEKGAVRCVGEVNPPRLIKKVDPVYPEAARQARVEGSVILGTRIDTQGRVSQVMVYSSKEFSLVRAAMDAVKQWVYEPLIIEGQTKEAVFTTTVNFKLGPEETDAAEVVGGVAGGVLKAGDSVTPPRLIKKVEPKYPIEARKALIQGMVVLEVTTDEEGNVAEAKVSRSDSSLLNQASIDAVKQWKYEPLMSKGKPVRLTFYVTLTFRLR